MLNDIVNITLYLYSSTTIVFVLMKSSQRRRLALTPALREKKKQTNKQTIIVQSLSPIPQESLLITGCFKSSFRFFIPLNFTNY